MSTVVVTLPDGSTREVESGTTPLQIAQAIGPRLAKATLAAKIDDKEVDVYFPITRNSKLQLITNNSKDKDGLEVIRHSTAHLLAMAIKELYPTAQITIGPVIEDGFYYDIDCPKQLTPEDLPTIEKKMAEIAARKLDVTREVWPRDKAVNYFEGIKEIYKAEIIKGLPANEEVSAYRQGDFIDLCRGPHVPNTEKLGKFKLLSIAGAYWRGDEKNKMLQRIYGTAFATQEDLDAYLHRIEEAKKRDHRKLGPELGIFTFLPAATAMPFYLPKGATLFNLLVDHMRHEVINAGYDEVICPQMMTNELWKTSGHWDNYRDNMFLVTDTASQGEEPTSAMKPMNCPGHCALFASTKHSYRELPLRYAEFTKLHRFERAGVTHGILRTRAFSQDDGHIFCTEDQIESESKALIDQTYRVYDEFGFDEIEIKLATRPEKYLGKPEVWDRAEAALARSLKASGRPFEYLPGEGAFYGPKIEFHVKDSLARKWQCGTIQLDYNFPERFQLEFINANNQGERPVMIHRAILGSVERFMGILIEHHNGHFPLWISPVQAKVISVSNDQNDYATQVGQALKARGLRVEVDVRYEKLGAKIRTAQLERTPLMLVLGAKEAAAQTISVRLPSGQNINELTMDKFIEFLEPRLKPGFKEAKNP